MTPGSPVTLARYSPDVAYLGSHYQFSDDDRGLQERHGTIWTTTTSATQNSSTGAGVHDWRTGGRIRCRFAYALDGEHTSKIDSDAGPGLPITADSLAANRIETVSWLMLFAPPLVAEYGREWVLDAPA